jgi:phage tail-like protein
MARRPDPYRNYNFVVNFDGRVVGRFRGVAVGPAVVEVAEFRDGNAPNVVRKVPGLHKTADVTLKRGLIASKALFDWFRAVANGEADLRKDVEIAQHRPGGGKPVARFVVRNAWPAKVTIGDLDARGNDIAIETLELAHEGFELA